MLDFCSFLCLLPNANEKFFERIYHVGEIDPRDIKEGKIKLNASKRV